LGGISPDQSNAWEASALGDALIDAARFAVLILDAEGRIVRINPYLERISGYALETLKGRSWVECMLPERERPACRERLDAVVAGGAPSHGRIGAIVTAARRERLLEWDENLLKSRDGKVIGVLLTGRDVAGRHVDERTMAAQLDELQRWHRLTLDREGRVIELKREVNALLRRAGKPDRYPAVETPPVREKSPRDEP
jgi:PAS domain S-box-containing protein